MIAIHLRPIKICDRSYIVCCNGKLARAFRYERSATVKHRAEEYVLCEIVSTCLLDSGRCADVVARNMHFSQQSYRGRTRGDRLTRVRRDRYAAVTEQLRAVDFDHCHNSRNCHDTVQDERAKQSCYDRHVNA